MCSVRIYCSKRAYDKYKFDYWRTPTMFYEAPEAKIFCFAPIENIAKADWDWSVDDSGSGSSSEFDFPFFGDEGNPDN